MPKHATLILRLDGPLQAWGVSSKWRIRQTQSEPSFSGVVGLLCAALGWDRHASLDPFQALQMAVRVDREGQRIHDYHTVGAVGRPPAPERFHGSLTAGGKIKRTQSTGEIETLVSERYYLADALFHVALSGPAEFLQRCADAVDDPVFPLYLGRKSCPLGAPLRPPGEELRPETDPVEALRACSRVGRQDRPPRQMRFVVPAPHGAPGAERRADVPRSFATRRFGVRYVSHEYHDVAGLPMIEIPFEPAKNANRYHVYNKAWDRKRDERLALDRGLCVFTGLPADEVHHATYARANDEDAETDLRSLSKLAHAAVTMLEAEAGMRRDRIDPLDERWAPAINEKIQDYIQHHDLSAADRMKQRAEQSRK